MKIGLIGNGAIAAYVRVALEKRGHIISAVLVRPTQVMLGSPLHVGTLDDLPDDLDVMIDCAGHAALCEHGPGILLRGLNLITISLGALADQAVYDALYRAAQEGGVRLHLASGAIGSLDCLQAARTGQLDKVTYTGRKRPIGWRGSPAEAKLDLAALTKGALTHFEGTARDAALTYPKNANVAAAVAIAGMGFDHTHVRLIADADAVTNIHEIEASGAFGCFQFQISGHTLPDNPRSSALAAMSVVSKLEQTIQPITL